MHVHGNFLTKKEKTKSGKSILLSNLNDYVRRLKYLCKKYNVLCTKIKQLTGKKFYLSIMNYINTLQYERRFHFIKTKNNKLKLNSSKAKNRQHIKFRNKFIK